MAKYNVVFQYLLRLKRIQGDLESSWAVMRRQAGRSRDLPLHTRRLPLWHLRHHMAYIIANLQIYVQVSLHVLHTILYVSDTPKCTYPKPDITCEQKQ